MSHTPEPWTSGIKHYPRNIYDSPGKQQRRPMLIAQTRADSFSHLAQANASRIVACVNGCAGLNPVAYRECVEALKVALDEMTHVIRSDGASPITLQIVREALAHAQEPT